MSKYIMRPVVVTAHQFVHDYKPWPDGVYKIGGELPGENDDLFFRFRGGDGKEVTIKDFDWVITHCDGNRSVCRNDQFHLCYEPYSAPDIESRITDADQGRVR